MYSIYRYWSPLNKSYIGQTCQPLFARSGLRGQNYHTSTKFYNAIQKYGFDWFKEHHEILASNLTKEQADNLEKYYIQKYNSINNGYNIQSGGTFNPAEICSKPIIGINCQTKDIEYFSSIQEAAIDKKINRRSINKVVNHEPNNYTMGGYVWLALSEWDELYQIEKEYYLNITPKIKNKNRQIICLNTLKVYNSIKEAEKDTHISNISACCRGVIKSAGTLNGEKVYWEYYDNYIQDKQAKEDKKCL